MLVQFHSLPSVVSLPAVRVYHVLVTLKQDNHVS